MTAVRCLLTLLLPAVLAVAQDDDVTRAMSGPPRPHPRLFLADSDLPALRARLAAQPLLRRTHERCLAIADAMLDAPPVTRELIGRRLLSVSRACLERVVHLGYAHRMTGEPRYLLRAQRELLAAAAFEDWNPSHFLDVAEMTAALAIGYDWLHDGLDAEARDAIAQAIVDKGLQPSLRGGWWVSTSNNWNQVCHGGLTLGALAVHERQPDLALRIVRRARENLPRATAEYEPDGAYPEGPSYWVYGTTYNVLLLDALRTALGDELGLADASGLMSSAEYLLHVTGPTGLFFNYSDGRAERSVAPVTYWFAARRGQPELLWHEDAALRALLDGGGASSGRGPQLLPFVLIWWQGGARTEPTQRHWHARGRTPVATHRTGWAAADTFVAVKAGTPSTNHAHMDVGSFVLAADGVRWAIDLGSQNYHSLESKGIRLWDRGQDGERWSVFRLDNASHNTLVVDGARQRVEGRGEILRSAAEGPMPHTIVDLSAAYAGQLADARRGVGLREDGVVVVQDEFTTFERAVTTVRWGMVTRAEVTCDGSAAVLQQEGRQLTLRVLEPAAARLTIYDTETPRSAFDAANQGTRMVGFAARLPANAAQRLVVVLVPGHRQVPALDQLPARLADW